MSAYLNKTLDILKNRGDKILAPISVGNDKANKGTLNANIRSSIP